MTKIRFYLWKYYKQIVLWAGIVFFAIVLIIYAKFTYSNFISKAAKRTDTTPYFDNTSSTDIDAIELSDQTVVEQTFTIDDAGLSYIILNFKKSGSLKKGKVVVSLININSGSQIQVWEKNVSKITNGKPVKFALEDEIKGGAQEGYKIQIIGKLEGKGKLNILSSADKSYYKGSLLIGDEEAMGDLLMRISPASTDNHFIKKVFYGIALGLITMILVIWLLANIKKEPNVETVFLVFMLFTGLAYMIVMPAYSTPDEPMHFATAYRTSNQFLRVEGDTDETRVLCRENDKMHREVGQTTTLDTYRYFYETLFDRADDGEMGIYDGSGSMGLGAPLMSHLPQAIGITIARLLHLSNAGLLVMGRLFALLTYIILTYYAIKIIPFGKQLLFAISGFPMLLEEVASYSHDGVICGLAFLLTAYILRLIYQAEKIKLKNYIILFVIAMALAPCKMVYSFLTLLIFLVPNRKFKNKGIAYAYKCILPAVVIMYAVGFNMGQVSNSAGGAHIIGWANEEGYTAAYLLHNMRELIKIYIMTYHEKMGLYLNGVIGGSLSWFNVNIPLDLVASPLILMIISLREYRPYRVKRVHTMIYILGFLFISILINTSMLLAWTPISYNYIEGVQGRYYLPILPLLMIPFVSATKEQEMSARRWVYMGSSIINFLVILRVMEINVMR